MSEDNPTPEDTDAPAGDAPQDGPSEPHGDDDGTDWVAEARKWEKRAKANSDAAARLQELEEANKSELQKAQERAEAAEKAAAKHESELMRMQVAAAKGLTPTQAKRLIGDTVEELEADADELLESFQRDDQPPVPPRKPREQLRSGAVADAEPEETDPSALASAIRQNSHGGRL